MDDNHTGTRIAGFVSLFSLISFLFGFFYDSNFFMNIGGSIILIQNIVGIFIGLLKPTFPIVLAIICASIIKPWYLGVFWSFAIFEFLNIPFNLKRIFLPHTLIKDSLSLVDNKYINNNKKEYEIKQAQTKRRKVTYENTNHRKEPPPFQNKGEGGFGEVVNLTKPKDPRDPGKTPLEASEDPKSQINQVNESKDDDFFADYPE